MLWWQTKQNNTEYGLEWNWSGGGLVTMLMSLAIVQLFALLTKRTWKLWTRPISLTFGNLISYFNRKLMQSDRKNGFFIEKQRCRKSFTSNRKCFQHNFDYFSNGHRQRLIIMFNEENVIVKWRWDVDNNNWKVRCSFFNVPEICSAAGHSIHW